MKIIIFIACLLFGNGYSNDKKSEYDALNSLTEEIESSGGNKSLLKAREHLKKSLNLKYNSWSEYLANNPSAKKLVNKKMIQELKDNYCNPFKESNNREIHFVGRHKGVKKLDSYISISGHGTTMVDVEVGRTFKPVVLILSSYDPVIWNIKVDMQAEIDGVIIDGYHRSGVIGLSKSIQILHSSRENSKKCALNLFSDKWRDSFEPKVKYLVGGNVDKFHKGTNKGFVQIGADINIVKAISDPYRLIDWFIDAKKVKESGSYKYISRIKRKNKLRRKNRGSSFDPEHNFLGINLANCKMNSTCKNVSSSIIELTKFDFAARTISGREGRYSFNLKSKGLYHLCIYGIIRDQEKTCKFIKYKGNKTAITFCRDCDIPFWNIKELK